MTQKDKKLKTNQMMTIEISKFGTIEIGHKTEMGNVSQVIDMGNKVRKENGLQPKLLDHILNKSEFWEFVIARNIKENIIETIVLENVNRIYSNFKVLENHKDSMGQIQYSELMQKFPHLINSRRGRYGGTFATLEILLKILIMLYPKSILEIRKMDKAPLDVSIFEDNCLANVRVLYGQKYIYVIQDGEFYKIGSARKVENRLKVLQVGNPRPLKVIFKQEVQGKKVIFLEKKLHKIFAKKHSLGEWFKLTTEDIVKLKNIIEDFEIDES